MQKNQYLVKKIFQDQIQASYRDQFHEMIYMDKAHGIMLVRQGLLDAEDYRVIADGLDRVEKDLKEEDLKGDLGDLYFNVTQKLYDIIGEKTGCLIHVGRSRNDMMCACNRMQIRRELTELMEEMNGLRELLLDLAEEHTETVITYYTYGQPAQPGTYGHYLLLVSELLSRDYTRLQAAYRNTNRSPMGAAAGIGTGYPLDLPCCAKLLGFDSVVEHSIDAVASTDYLLEAEAAITIMMSNMSKVAQDFFFWASYEYRLLDCNASIVSGSSIMPQKKNPELFEHMRAQTARAMGMFSDALEMSRNTTLFPNMESILDMFSDFGIWMKEVKKVLGLLKEGLKNTKIRKKESYEYTHNNFTGASSMAEYLARKYQVPFTETHEIIHDMLSQLMENDTLEVQYMTGELMKEVSEKILGRALVMTDEEVRQMLDPMFCLNEKVTGGTPKPEDTKQLISGNRKMLEEQKQWLEKCKEQINRAYEQIRKGV